MLRHIYRGKSLQVYRRQKLERIQRRTAGSNRRGLVQSVDREYEYGKFAVPLYSGQHSQGSGCSLAREIPGQSRATFLRRRFEASSAKAEGQPDRRVNGQAIADTGTTRGDGFAQIHATNAPNKKLEHATSAR